MDTNRRLKKVMAAMLVIWVLMLLVAPAELRNQILLDFLAPLVYLPLWIAIICPILIGLVWLSHKKNEKSHTDPE